MSNRRELVRPSGRPKPVPMTKMNIGNKHTGKRIIIEIPNDDKAQKLFDTLKLIPWVTVMIEDM